ncbi:MAG: ArgE/DapE family deacylase [Gaiellaceae bacterium]
MNALEQRVLAEIERRSDDLVALAGDLIRFDTTAREPDDPPRDEAALQRYLGERLRAAGAEIDLWEPAPEDVAGSRLVPPGLAFAGRPQLLARFPGSGGGRSLLLNGHIDAVSVEPRERWTSDPHVPVVRDGRLYGRGSVDMKGGVAAMTFAAETLALLGVRLEGDLLVNTVTDEESTGAGGVASVAHGVRADAGIVTEPSGFDVWVACRGSLMPTISVAGRPGHAGLRQPHWREGGAVNAIEKAAIVQEALRRLQEEWRHRADNRHPYLSPGEIVPTLVAGGEWIVSYPASCAISYHVAYLPAQADEDGWGNAVEQELEEHVARAARADPWLAEHPPQIAWATDVPAAEVSPDEPIVQTMLAAAKAAGRPGQVSGMDSWHDGATYTHLAGTPCICFGPGQIEASHTVDESVAVRDLVDCARALALAALRFCGAALVGGKTREDP